MYCQASYHSVTDSIHAQQCCAGSQLLKTAMNPQSSAELASAIATSCRLLHKPNVPFSDGVAEIKCTSRPGQHMCTSGSMTMHRCNARAADSHCEVATVQEVAAQCEHASHLWITGESHHITEAGTQTGSFQHPAKSCLQYTPAFGHWRRVQRFCISACPSCFSTAASCQGTGSITGCTTTHCDGGHCNALGCSISLLLLLLP